MRVTKLLKFYLVVFLYDRTFLTTVSTYANSGRVPVPYSKSEVGGP